MTYEQWQMEREGARDVFDLMVRRAARNATDRRAREQAEQDQAKAVSKSDLELRNAYDYAEYDWGKFLKDEGEVEDAEE